MWIFMNDAFLSIVQHKDDPDSLLVRARRKEDLLRTFPDRVPYQVPHSDYAWRTAVPRTQVQEMLCARVSAIDYPNFKASVKDKRRAAVYADVWAAAYSLQE